MRYIQIITTHWLSLLLATVITSAIAMGLSFIPDQLYESEIELLIVQKNVNSDTYTAQKAAEKLGTNLSSVVHSFDFLDRVIATGYVAESTFSEVNKDKQKEWQKLVTTQVIPETSIIRVYGYGLEPTEAEDVVIGVSQVLTTNAADYHGAGESVSIKKITGPITSVRPVKPNIALNTVAGGILGFMMLYTIYLLRFESKRMQKLEEQERQTLHYQAINQPNGAVNQLPPAEEPVDMFSMNTDAVEVAEYKVLDTFPTDGYAFGETIEGEDSAVSMQDHMKSTPKKK